jgi:hypothetical protein
MRSMNRRHPLFSFHYFPYVVIPLALFISVGSWDGLAAETPASRSFYVPADPQYTLVDSTADSLRFTLTKTLQPDSNGHLVSISGFVDPEGAVMGWHDFGNLEGPGWAANAVGGAWEIYTMGGFLRNPKFEIRSLKSEVEGPQPIPAGRIGKLKLDGAQMQSNALAILDHVLEGGFIDPRTGFIRGYRETTTGKFCLNYKHNSDWFCPGSMAKVAFQLLLFADELGHTARARRMRSIAVRCAEWIQKNVEPVPNGWFPRRADSTGKVYRKSPEGGQDSLWQTSADGLFILQLQAALTKRGLADYSESLKEEAGSFIQARGIFGSINHDTYDPRENVAYSIAFRTFLLASRVLKDEELRRFAFEKCLQPLDQFKMCEDRNGVATKGLLYMEKSWDTAYLWENAEAALAFFEAASELRRTEPAQSREYELDGLVILRAIAKHHYGPWGFLTEGVDWNNHVGQKHHIGQAKYAAIQYTEPFLNNQHIVEPTLFYLKHLARKTSRGSQTEWFDIEGNLLLRR